MRAALSLVALAACSSPAMPGVDATPPDASVDAVDAQADAPGPPGPLDGAWSVSWSCVHLCAPDPELLSTQRLTVAGGALRWDSSTCPECVVDHVGTVRGTCIDVPAGLDNANDDRAGYTICATSAATLTATIAVRRVGGVAEAASWRVDGVRQ